MARWVFVYLTTALGRGEGFRDLRQGVSGENVLANDTSGNRYGRL